MKKKLLLLALISSAAMYVTACGHEHEWVDATCEEPMTCATCGETEGEALGHDYEDATCTEPSTCSVCGDTQGDALGHDWMDATFSEPQICSRCDETNGEALSASIDFVYDKEFVLNYSLGISDPDDTEYVDFEQYEFDTSEQSTLTIESVSAEETEDGQSVVYTMVVSIYAHPLLRYDETKGDECSWRWHSYYPYVQLYDTVTGQVYPEKGTDGDEIMEFNFNISYNGKDYPIFYTEDVANENAWEDWFMCPDGVWGSYLMLGNTCTYSVCVPKDYDSLGFAIVKEGVTKLLPLDWEYPDPDLDNLRTVLDPDEDGDCYGIDDYYFLRADDMVALFAE